MAAHGHPAAATIALLLLFPLIAFAEEPPSLEILPSGDTQTKPIGSSIIMTCKPKVEVAKLISDMQWLDPQNRVVESLNTFPGHSQPPMYTELHQDNSLSLYFNSLQEELAGKYTCKGTYANSIYLNKSVTIDTIVAITWDDAPENQNPILGEDFAIQCKVRARPSPLVDWLYNGELIKTNDHYIIDKYALKIKNVQESDDGIYTCRASVLTTGELKERPIRVEVHVRPTVEELPSSIDIIEGEDASIECKAHGKPPPRYTWVKAVSQQNLSNTDRFGVDPNNGVLTITNVNRDDLGVYECQATNAAGMATMKFVVNVIVKPKIIEFKNEKVVEEQKATIECRAFGRPPPQVTFRKHTSEKVYVKGSQPDDDRIILENMQNSEAGETLGTLTIDKVMRSNDGLYECIAQNAGGEARQSGHLTVEFPPSFASMPNKTVWSWEQRPVNVSCIAESIPNATIRWTIYGDKKIDKDPRIKQLGTGPFSTLMILPMERRYYTTYKCIASNLHGIKEHNIELREATKPGVVQQAKMIEITATTIRFELVPPTTHPELPIRTIVVQYREDRQTWSEAKNKTLSVGAPYIIENLRPQTAYEFRFAARNEVGLGDWGAEVREMTPVRTSPNQPKIITSMPDCDMSTYGNQYELSWLVPADNGEPIDMYQVNVCQVKRTSNDWEILKNTCHADEIKTQGRTRHWLKNLNSDTVYQVELRAHNAIGYSQPGISKFKTARESTGTTTDYYIDSSAGDTPKLAVTAIATAITILFVAI